MIFDVFYKNKIKLIHSMEEYKVLNDIYKDNYFKAKSFEELRSKFLINPHPIVEFEFHKQYDAKKGLQGGITSELVVLATIAEFLNMTSFSYENGEYIYENNEYKFVLQGNKGHGKDTTKSGNDIIIFDKINNKYYNCEIKEPYSRCGEMDWNYTEEGKLCKTSRAKKDKLPLFQPIADAYNAHMSVFNHIGHNYPLSEEIVKDILRNYFGVVDYILTFTEKENYLLFLPNNEKLFNEIYTHEGSEIRTVNGKNLKSIFTPIYAKKILDKYLAKEEKGFYYFNLNDFIYTPGRQSVLGRYKLKEGFAIKEEDCVIENNFIKCLKDNFKQNGALISPKIRLKYNYDQIKKLILEGGYDIDK